MSQILALREAVRTSIDADARFAGVEVSTHGGSFDADEIVRYARRSPKAIVVATLGVKTEWQGGAVFAHVSMGAAVVTLDQSGMTAERKDRSNLTVTDALLRFLTSFGPAPFYGLDWLGAPVPDSIDAKNVYSRKLDTMGVALWLVTWKQSIDLRDDAVIPDELLQIHADFDIAPRDNDQAIGEAIDMSSDMDMDP